MFIRHACFVVFHITHFVFIQAVNFVYISAQRHSNFRYCMLFDLHQPTGNSCRSRIERFCYV